MSLKKSVTMRHAACRLNYLTVMVEQVKTMFRIGAQLLLAALLATVSARAQAPTGIPAGTPIAGARVRFSGLSRSLSTSAEGYYSAAALPPSVYEVTAEADGFGPLERTATVETGTTTTLNLTLQVGEISEQVTVDTAAPLMQYEHHQVGGWSVASRSRTCRGIVNLNKICHFWIHYVEVRNIASPSHCDHFR